MVGIWFTLAAIIAPSKFLPYGTAVVVLVLVGVVIWTAMSTVRRGCPLQRDSRWIHSDEVFVEGTDMSLLLLNCPCAGGMCVQAAQFLRDALKTAFKTTVSATLRRHKLATVAKPANADGGIRKRTNAKGEEIASVNVSAADALTVDAQTL